MGFWTPIFNIKISNVYGLWLFEEALISDKFLLKQWTNTPEEWHVSSPRWKKRKSRGDECWKYLFEFEGFWEGRWNDLAIYRCSDGSISDLIPQIATSKIENHKIVKLNRQLWLMPPCSRKPFKAGLIRASSDGYNLLITNGLQKKIWL